MAQTVFVLAFVVLIVGFIVYNMAAGMALIPQFQTGGGAKGLEFMNNYPAYMDWLPLAIYGVMLLVSVYAARRATEKGLSLIISYFMIIIITVVILALGFILNAIFNSAALVSYATQLPITAFYAEYALIFGVLYALIVIVALHGGADE